MRTSKPSASRLGIGARQLRRLFDRHLGASAVAIARARRVHFARRLLDETALPITEIAFSAGFRSIRQFNHAMLATFRRSPTELRRQRGRRGPLLDERGIVVRLPYRPPFDWQRIITFLAARATPGVEEVGDGFYRRTVEIDGASGVIEVRPSEDESCLRMHARLARYEGLIHVVEGARRIFDLGADPLQIASDLRRSATLAQYVENCPGIRVPHAWDSFELAVRAVLGQQVTVKGATTLAGRLVQAFGRQIDACGTLTHLFPTPAALAAGDLTRIGIPGSRARTVRSLAAAVAGGELVLDAARGLDDAISRLCAIPGIGSWTAHYIAMRAFGEPDAFPTDDLGLRQAVANRTSTSSRQPSWHASPKNGARGARTQPWSAVDHEEEKPR